jgi:hypothetical protein
MTRGAATRQFPFAVLREFASRSEPAERCELCGTALAPEHAHLVELAVRRLMCCCDACALLVGSQQEGRYRRVRPHLDRLPDFRMTVERWASLGVPVKLAFFCPTEPTGRVVAVYPSPAGVIEETVPTEAWDGLVGENPTLRNLEPHAEALLVNRSGLAADYYRASLDRCYELVGLVRKHWQGFSGGAGVAKHVERFFGRDHEHRDGRADR